jgi:hypothetical protein
MLNAFHADVTPGRRQETMTRAQRQRDLFLIECAMEAGLKVRARAIWDRRLLALIDRTARLESAAPLTLVAARTVHVERLKAAV